MQLPQSLSRLAALAGGAGSSRWARSLPLWITVLLVLLLAWQLVQLAWAVMGARRPVAAAGPSQPVVAATQGPAIDVPTILNAHLFGVAGAAPGGATDPNSVAATQMALVLVGTIAESDPLKGYAIIGDSPTTAKVYAVGKTITGGTKLHSVYPDRAILDRGGKLEALLLPRKFTGAGLTPASTPVAQGDPMLGDQLRQMASQNPEAITDILRPQPVFANGQQRGYRVYPGRNRDVFAKLGLMPGDLVTAINGTPLDDPTRGMEVMQTMNSATDVTVTVERNGQTTQISINNAQIAAQAAAAAIQSEAIPVSEVPQVSPQQDQSE